VSEWYLLRGEPVLVVRIAAGKAYYMTLRATDDGVERLVGVTDECSLEPVDRHATEMDNLLRQHGIGG
jgi:hypothetical protein